MRPIVVDNKKNINQWEPCSFTFHPRLHETSFPMKIILNMMMELTWSNGGRSVSNNRSWLKFSPSVEDRHLSCLTCLNLWKISLLHQYPKFMLCEIPRVCLILIILRWLSSVSSDLTQPPVFSTHFSFNKTCTPQCTPLTLKFQQADFLKPF